MIWRFQSRCSSKITPRYLTLLQVLIFCPLILKFRCFVICFCLGLKIIISVLLVLRLILFAWSHQEIKARSWFTYLLIFLRDFSVSSKFVSSAYWCSLEFLTDLFKSFLKIIKSRGPSTEPCGTPWETIFLDNSFRSIEVYWTLSHIKDLNQSKLVPFFASKYLDWLCQMLFEDQDKHRRCIAPCHMHFWSVLLSQLRHMSVCQ